MADSLTPEIRVRDLVHGYVELTALERRIVDTPLFQRLRNIRQNDVAFYVYPSLNISRFEHSLGCAHVAGKMAQSIVRSPCWHDYSQDARLSAAEFQQVARLYALLHDVGHLPLSHLFETAFEDFVYKTGNPPLMDACSEWFGTTGFNKLHEACGSVIAATLLEGVPAPIGDMVRLLTSKKKLGAGDALKPLKLLVDSEVDADRIDATARDGLLAGREYGTFDGDRIASSVRLRRSGSDWGLAYSDKALSSMEALLLDRYRTHTWIHFHHRVVAMKVAATEVVGQMLVDKVITKDDFLVAGAGMPLRDDTWLWGKIREWEPGSEAAHAAKRALLYRDNSQVTLLWKNRADYEAVQRELREASGKRELGRTEFGRKYEQELQDRLGIRAAVLWLSFKPVGSDIVPIVSEAGQPRSDLLALSPLAGTLGRVWQGEPQYFVVLLGKYEGTFQEIRQRWIDETVRWLNH